jgi:branched-chain amino acid aminotransferase
MKIWFDGKMRNQGDTPVSVKSHTLHYGTAVFEGIRSYLTSAGATPFKLGEHIERLFRSAHAIGLVIPFSEADLRHAIHQVLGENELADAYIRPLVYLGEGSMGLDVQTIENANPVHVMISAWEWPSYFDHGRMAGIQAMISNHRRVFSSPALAQAKASGHYLGSYCAHMDAKKCSYDEAMLLDEAGYLAEAFSANLFFVSRGEIYTPFVKMRSAGSPGIPS